MRRLDLLASRRATATVAYESALDYAIAGLQVLAKARGQRTAISRLALGLQRANCEYLTGALESARDRLSSLASRPIGLPAQCQVTCLRALVHQALGRPDEAVAMCLEQLHSFGIDWHPRPSVAVIFEEYQQLQKRLPAGGPATLLELPTMTDASWRACIEVMLAVQPVTVFSDKALYDLVVIRMANICIEHGISDLSPLSFSELALVLWPRFGERLLGFQFGELGRALVEQRGLRRSSAPFSPRSPVRSHRGGRGRSQPST